MRLLSNLHVKDKPAVLPDRAILSQSHYVIYRPLTFKWRASPQCCQIVRYSASRITLFRDLVFTLSVEVLRSHLIELNTYFLLLRDCSDDVSFCSYFVKFNLNYISDDVCVDYWSKHNQTHLDFDIAIQHNISSTPDKHY